MSNSITHRFESQMNSALDPFSDLLWEESLDVDRSSNRVRKETNLSSEIENYLKRSA